MTRPDQTSTRPTADQSTDPTVDGRSSTVRPDPTRPTVAARRAARRLAQSTGTVPTDRLARVLARRDVLADLAATGAVPVEHRSDVLGDVLARVLDPTDSTDSRVVTARDALASLDPSLDWSALGADKTYRLAARSVRFAMRDAARSIYRTADRERPSGLPADWSTSTGPTSTDRDRFDLDHQPVARWDGTGPVPSGWTRATRPDGSTVAYRNLDSDGRPVTARAAAVAADAPVERPDSDPARSRVRSSLVYAAAVGTGTTVVDPTADRSIGWSDRGKRSIGMSRIRETVGTGPVAYGSTVEYRERVKILTEQSLATMLDRAAAMRGADRTRDRLDPGLDRMRLADLSRRWMTYPAPTVRGDLARLILGRFDLYVEEADRLDRVARVERVERAAGRLVGPPRPRVERVTFGRFLADRVTVADDRKRLSESARSTARNGRTGAPVPVPARVDRKETRGHSRLDWAAALVALDLPVDRPHRDALQRLARKFAATVVQDTARAGYGAGPGSFDTARPEAVESKRYGYVAVVPAVEQAARRAPVGWSVDPTPAVTRFRGRSRSAAPAVPAARPARSTRDDRPDLDGRVWSVGPAPVWSTSTVRTVPADPARIGGSSLAGYRYFDTAGRPVVPAP